MHIFLPEVKARHGEVIDYFFEGPVPESYGPEVAGNGTLQLKVSVRSSGAKIIVSGTLEAEVDALCSRCVKPFRQRFTSDFQETFTVVPSSAEPEDPVQAAVETANELTVTGDYLYLDEFLRQIFILAQQFNPLCKADCLGLCPGCGADLNNEPCRCSAEPEIDARLIKLKEFHSRG
ncbi:MAG: DUF177 domain-containing protein [Firmicutes bacterium]|jgi:uncharacterized protein|nr:DUF177 domain-containing protein [Bacillota bacterium]